MIVTLKTQGLQTLEQVRNFLDGNKPIEFEISQRDAAYDFIAQQLRLFGYIRQKKADKGLIRSYLCKVTGLS